jgi:hypothetical protein
VAYRGLFGVFKLPPPKFRSFDKAEPNSHFRGKYIRNNLIRIRVSVICKLSGTPDKGATAPSAPFSLLSVLNWIRWTPHLEQNSWLRHCYAWPPDTLGYNNWFKEDLKVFVCFFLNCPAPQLCPVYEKPFPVFDFAK